MREISLPKVDEKGNHIPDESTPTKEELRRDLANGTRVLNIQQDRWNELFVGEDPNGDLDGDLIRAILAEAAAVETNIAAQVALEDWDSRRAAPRVVDGEIVACLDEFRANFDKGWATHSRQSRRRKLDTYRVTLTLNFLAALGSAAIGPDFEAKARKLMRYAFGEIEWDQLKQPSSMSGDADGSRAVNDSKQTLH